MSWILPPAISNWSVPADIWDLAAALGISFEEAALVKAGFENALGDEKRRADVFEMMDELDEQKYAEGESERMNVSFGIELSYEGVKVLRYAKHLKPGQEPMPREEAVVWCRITEGYPTDKWMGPVIIERPEKKAAEVSEEPAVSAEPISSDEQVLVGPTVLANSKVTVKEKALRELILLRRTEPAFGDVCPFMGDEPWAWRPSVGSFALSFPTIPLQAIYTSSGASPPSIVGDHGHSGMKAVLCN